MDEDSQTCLCEWALYREEMKDGPGEGEATPVLATAKLLPPAGLERPREETLLPELQVSWNTSGPSQWEPGPWTKRVIQW